MNARPMLLLGLAASAWGAGLDRDGLLTEAPATPEPGTVRVAGGGTATWAGPSTGSVTGTVLWAAFHHFAADVGAYWQDGDSGPTVRVRYQLLDQATLGVDLAAGVRYKSTGFDPRNGEVEALVSLGRRFGPVDTIVNLVAGHELGGPGLDVEAKALVGYRLTEALRVGLDGRLQAEVHDESGWKSPDFAADVAVVGGAAVSVLPVPAFQLQLLIGASKPRGTAASGLTAHLRASYDF
jgi:hypothetical protein